MREKNTKKSRGFGFIIFKETESVQKLISSNVRHIINGKLVDCKPSVAKEEMSEESDLSRIIKNTKSQNNYTKNLNKSINNNNNNYSNIDINSTVNNINTPINNTINVI